MAIPKLAGLRLHRVLPVIVQQHADDTADLYETRTALSEAANVNLGGLQRLDERLAAHLDGLVIAGKHGSLICTTGLESPSAGRVFAVAMRAIDEKDLNSMARMLALTEVLPDVSCGLISAFAWSRPEQLQGIVANLLQAKEPNFRKMGITACAIHSVADSALLQKYSDDANGAVRAQALRAAAKCGRRELASTCAAAMRDENEECRFWAAWSAVLLGNRGVGLDALTHNALTPGASHCGRALRLSLQAMDTPSAHAVLQNLAKDSAQLRGLIQGSGIAGDPAYVPWLIGHMSNDQTARLAGEAFSLITGADLALLDLERKPPENFESGPNDDPDDPNVDMDPDDGLPRPDPDRSKDWWAKNNHRFPPGTRYFMGAPVTRAHCIDVLKNGYQRQRILAAHYLCLLDPGTPLFNTSAPAWRQQKLLAQMS
jgi:uncharacterized protein (TIGR02270 family)